MKFIFLLFFSLIMCSSCNSKISIIDKNLAEIREFLYEGQVEGMTVSLMCGKREKDYILDGYATALIEFGVLTFDIENIEEYDTAGSKYVLYVGNTKYEGDLQKNPFDGTLVADIKKNICVSSGVSVKIILNDYEKEIKLKRMDSEWNINAEDVKKIIYSNFKEEISLLRDKKEFRGEIYIKILNDADIYASDYYWYVSIISRTGGRLNAIISNKTGEILSLNNTLNNI